MTTDNLHDIDARILDGLNGSQKLKLLLAQQAGSVADWARGEGIDPIGLHHCLAGRRESDAYRQRMADSVGLDRAVVDAMIGPVKSKEAASAA
jgi:hypothetical protein